MPPDIRDNDTVEDIVKAGARAVARVLLIDRAQRILLLRAVDPGNGQTLWVTPGGGVEPGETFEAAAQRELQEETGLNPVLGPWVWTRRHAYEWDQRSCDQYERFFVAMTTSCDLAPEAEDSCVVEKRWWTLEDLQRTSHVFAPRQLAQLLPRILRGEYPAAPCDCGV